MGLAVVLGTVQYGELPNFFDFGSKTSKSYPFYCKVHISKKSEGQKIKNKNYYFGKILSLRPI